MKLLHDIEIKSGHRIIWISEKAKETWSAAIERINNDIQRTELVSVAEDQRKCGTVTTSPRDIISIGERYPELVFEPLQAVRKFEGFAHRHADPEGDKDYYIFYAYSKTVKGVKDLRRAFEKNDHVGIGKLLGFPECCGRFFETSWSAGFIDPIWQAAENTYGILYRNKRTTIEISNAHPYSNMILRYVGVRAGFHIPCNFRCTETIEVGSQRVELLSPDLKKILDALLSMPMEWSVLHGIAEIRTPIFWIVTGSVRSKDKHTVKIHGQFLPKENAVSNIA